MTVLLSICALIFVSQMAQPGECSKQAVFRRNEQKYLANHVIETKQTDTELECGMKCLRHGSCASVNYKTSGIGKGLCELNSQTLEETSDADGKTKREFNHLAKIEMNYKENKELLQVTKKRKDLHSCKDVLTRYKNSTNGNYGLSSITSGEFYVVYCHMTDIATCGGGGWTLVMKLDGKKNTFTYDSPLWTNNETYAIQDGLEGLAEKESKLASYWNTPFTKICLGMSYSGDRKWMTFDYTASSLYSVIADGQFTATTAGRAAWKSLIAGSSLQYNCNKEGFNVRFLSAMRIGIVANDNNDCDSCDSWLGYGTSISGKACGNFASGRWIPDNGGKDLATFGYILVQ